MIERTSGRHASIRGARVTSSRRPAEHGFTLLETLVALAVFSLAAMALIRLQSVTIRTAADLDSKVSSQIVAHNLMVQLRTDPQAPGLGEADGDVENDGRTWHWTRLAKKTDDARVLQIDLLVQGAPGQSPAALSFVRALP